MTKRDDRSRDGSIDWTMMVRKKVAVFLSAGGASFFEALNIAGDIDLDFLVVTDRECAALDECASRKIECKHIPFRDRLDFSEKAGLLLESRDVQCSLFLFSRIIGPTVYERWPSFNIHPALLPSFPGLGAVRSALKADVKFIGATLHRIDASVDGGPILAQTVTPIEDGVDLTALNRVSFLQKTLLVLKAFEIMMGIHHGRGCARLNPDLATTELKERFQSFQRELAVSVYP